MKLAKWFGAAAVAVAVLGLAACGASNKESGNGKDKTVTIKIGTMTIDNDEQQRWDLIQKKLEKENVKLDFTPFTEYPQVNKAVMSMLSNTTTTLTTGIRKIIRI